MSHSDDHSASEFGPALDMVETAPAVPLGRRAFIAGTAGAIAATAWGANAEAAAVPSGASYYQPVNPVRLADTRTSGRYADKAKNFERIGTTLSRIKILDSPYATDVPSDAVAVVVSIVAIHRGTSGWVAAQPTGSSKVVSNINYASADGDVANLATVKIGNGGKIDVKSRFPCDVVVDIQGVYRATTVKKREGRVQFLSETTRALRNVRMRPGTWRTVLLPFVSTSASAVAVNLTVSGCRTQGWLAAAAVRSASRPRVSNLNYARGDERAAAAIVQLGNTNGTPSIEIYSNGDAQVFVDVSASFTGPSAVTSEEGLFVPIDPNRVMDTRRTTDFARTGKKRLWPGWTRAFELPQSTAGFGLRSQMMGVAMNATLVTSMRSGFVTALAAQTRRQVVSNVNPARVGHTVANHVITQVSSKGVEMYARCGGDVIADVAGWYVGPPRAVEFRNPTPDPPAPEAPFNWTLTVPRIGLQNLVMQHPVGDAIVDSGNTWHWNGTGIVGQENTSIVVFGHRTSKGGPYRNQHLLGPGDELILDIPDRRQYRYRYVGERITNWVPRNIHDAARANSPGTTITMVSCTGRGTQNSPGVKNDLPSGGVHWRLVTTFRLVRWTDTQRLQAPKD